MKNFTRIIAKLLPVMLFLAGIGFQAHAVDVTFRVDMSNETVSPDGVHVAGSFQGWNPGTTQMTALLGNVYSVTVAIDAGTEIEYKFINGNTWGGVESVPAACGTGPDNNRYFTVPNEDVVMDVVCFSSCIPCSANVDVTFRVDMSNETVSPLGVHIAGAFQGWNPASTEMTLTTDNIYVYTTSLAPGTTYEYKFINGTSWDDAENVSGSCTTGGYNNRYITVPDNDTTLTAVCFGSCVPCEAPTAAVTFQVDMQWVDVSADGVHIAGTFNDWDPAADEMTLSSKSGLYEITLDLIIGEMIEFKYVNGNTGDGMETIPQECSQNGNRYFEIPANDTTLDVVCYGQCEACGSQPVEVQLTFKVDMSQQTVSADGVHIAGSFQGWNPGGTLMNPVGGGIYVYTATLMSGYYHEYKFINGNTWDGAEFLPDSCSFNGNRYLTIPDVNTVLDTVCFGSCAGCPPPPKIGITFQVDMTNETVAPEGVHLQIASSPGSITPMVNLGNNIWAITMELDEGLYVMYKFMNGDQLAQSETVPPECSQEDGFRFLTVPGAPTTLDAVCFGECGPCIPPEESLVTFRVDMSNETVSPDGVHIAGSFQGWDPAATPMTGNGNGIYSVTLSLVESAHHTYKYINGTSFDYQENVPQACGEDDGYGNYNRFVDVPVNDTVLDVVCFSRCTECPPPVEVTFQVDMSNETVSPEGVHIVGDFQGWDPAASLMTDAGNGIYTYMMTLYAGDYHEYKFINGNTWDGQENVPQECGVDNGYGNFNRYFNVPSASGALDVVCFSSCTACAIQHVINIPAGWSGLSSWVMPGETNLDSLLNAIYPELVILKTMGAMYYPSQNINTIGAWESQSAYKIKVTQDVTLTIAGVAEQNKTVQLGQGWNLIPVISENPVDVEALFSGITDKVVVVKEIAGNGVYWLQYNINTIGNLTPGRAYFVLMNEAGEIVFP